MSNPRTEEVESADRIVARVRRARAIRPGGAIFLNPDCGFATFSNRAMSSPELAERKLSVIVEAARRLRAEG